jgi:hypothetical protein
MQALKPVTGQGTSSLRYRRPQRHDSAAFATNEERALSRQMSKTQRYPSCVRTHTHTLQVKIIDNQAGTHRNTNSVG